MHRLAKLGYSQSYTYFTWRNTKQELIEYFTELTPGRRAASTSGPTPGRTRPTSCTSSCTAAAGRCSCRASCSRPRWPPTTASTVRPTSCCEGTPREPGSEEYRDSEKYQLRRWDMASEGNLRRVHRAHQPHPAREPGAAATTGACASARSTTTSSSPTRSSCGDNVVVDGRQPRPRPRAVGLARARSGGARRRGHGRTRCTTC